MLETNIGPEAALAYKQCVGVRLLMASYALMIGLWQISDPPACLAAAMERPDMYMFNVDLEKQLGAVLVNLWEGAILRHGGGST